MRKYKEVTRQESILGSDCDESNLIGLYKTWEYNNGFEVPHELSAFTKLLNSKKYGETFVITIFCNNKPIGFSINEQLNSHAVNCLFAKGDISYSGVNAYLMNETAKILCARGYTEMNYEQDLGIFNLRKAKEAFDPTFLKKYQLSLVVNVE